MQINCKKIFLTQVKDFICKFNEILSICFLVYLVFSCKRVELGGPSHPREIVDFLFTD